MAQSNVYSLNVVGYVNVPLKSGFTLLENPLDAGDNTVSNVFKNVDYTQNTYAVLTWNGSFFVENDLDQFDGTWQNPTFNAAPGTGFFFKNPGSTITNTFVGNVLQGALSVSVTAQSFNLVGSKVPQDGYVSDLGLIPTGGDAILLWNGSFFVETDFDEFDSTWTPAASSGYIIDSVKGPLVSNANSFFYKNIHNSATWVRNFTVQ